MLTSKKSQLKIQRRRLRKWDRDQAGGITIVQPNTTVVLHGYPYPDVSCLPCPRPGEGMYALVPGTVTQEEWDRMAAGEVTPMERAFNIVERQLRRMLERSSRQYKARREAAVAAHNLQNC